MVSKKSRSDKEWKLSDAQRQEREQQRQAAKDAELERLAYWRLCGLFGGNLPVGVYFRNGMDSHFEVISGGSNGEWLKRDLTAEEKIPSPGYLWLTTQPVGFPRMPPVLNQHEYEAVALRKVNMNKPGSMHGVVCVEE